MKRSTLKYVAILLAIPTLACSPNGPSKQELAEKVDRLEANNEALIEKVNELTEQLDTAREKVAQVSSAADDVQEAADRFDGENWRDVVPDVQSASDDLDTAKTEAAEAVEEQ